MKYNRAINGCKNKDGTLARHLDAAAYRNLKAHLSDGHQYWIGLSNRNELTNATSDCFHGLATKHVRMLIYCKL